MQQETQAGSVAQRGRDRYERDLRARLESSDAGRFLALDVHTGEYEVADTLREASRRLRARVPDAVVFGVRIGRRAAYRFGGHRRLTPS